MPEIPKHQFLKQLFNEEVKINFTESLNPIDGPFTDPPPNVGETIDKKDAFQFAEWAGYNFIRLSEVWVHRYADASGKENWKTTEDLYIFWCNTHKSG